MKIAWRTYPRWSVWTLLTVFFAVLKHLNRGKLDEILKKEDRSYRFSEWSSVAINCSCPVIQINYEPFTLLARWFADFSGNGKGWSLCRFQRSVHRRPSSWALQFEHETSQMSAHTLVGTFIRWQTKFPPLTLPVEERCYWEARTYLGSARLPTDRSNNFRKTPEERSKQQPERDAAGLTGVGLMNFDTYNGRSLSRTAQHDLDGMLDPWGCLYGKLE